MHEPTLRRLEFPAIRQQLGALCSFAPSRELAEALAPVADRGQIQRWQEETAEARRFLAGFGGLPAPLVDVRAALRRAEKGGRLGGAELVAVADFAEAQAALGEAVRRSGAWPRLAELAAPLRPFPELTERIRWALIADGDVRDQASPELQRLRERARSLSRRLRERLEELARDLGRQGYLQEPLVTQRDGRFVLPVRSEHRAQVPGIVHDRSGSGLTVFIEPAQVAALQRALDETEAAARREVDRILDELSRLVGGAADALRAALEAAAYLDLVLARGRLAAAMNATEPELLDEPAVHLVGARHPLLGERAVPIDIELGRDFTLLIITGPNTGGKTVALKTLGLLVAMVQAGLQVPCRRAQCGVFRRIFADIGDEQSLEQNLSTFSAHLSHIIGFLPEVGPDSLVLLDELGAGTDPEEGAALAMALLDALQEAGARTAVTTHLGPLKTYAYRSAQARNASVEFDVETLAPTYHLRLGLPGRSHALTVAARLGLPPRWVERARSYLTRERVELDEVLGELDEARRQTEEERQRLLRERAQVERLRQEWSEKRRQLEESRRRFSERERAQALARLNRVYEEAERLLAELRRAQAQDRAEADRIGTRTRRRLQALERDVRALLEGAEPADEAQPEAEAAREATPPDGHAAATGGAATAGSSEVRESDGARIPQAGDRVFVPALGQLGTIVAAADGQELWVQVGALRVRLHADEVRPAPSARQEPEAPPATRAAPSVQAWMRAKAGTVAASLHLRGLTRDEALWQLDKYLDDAFAAGLDEVTIIHGKGTGTLREAVHDVLRRDRRVESFRLGGPGEGSYGVTVVRLRRDPA